MNQLIQILAAFAGTFFFSSLYNLRGAKLLVAGLGGMCTWSVCLAVTAATENEYFAFLLAAMLSNLAAELLARWFKTPTTTFVVPMLIPLIPGGSLYDTMGAAVARDWMQFAQKGQDTIFLSLSLAAGIMAVSSVKRLLDGFLAIYRETSRNGCKKG